MAENRFLLPDKVEGECGFESLLFSDFSSGGPIIRNGGFQNPCLACSKVSFPVVKRDGASEQDLGACFLEEGIE